MGLLQSRCWTERQRLFLKHQLLFPKNTRTIMPANKHPSIKCLNAILDKLLDLSPGFLTYKMVAVVPTSWVLWELWENSVSKAHSTSPATQCVSFGKILILTITNNSYWKPTSGGLSLNVSLTIFVSWKQLLSSRSTKHTSGMLFICLNHIWCPLNTTLSKSFYIKPERTTLSLWGTYRKEIIYNVLVFCQQIQQYATQWLRIQNILCINLWDMRDVKNAAIHKIKMFSLNSKNKCNLFLI